MNFVKLALENGGSIHPLIIPSSDLKGPALTNPSIYNDNGKILVNLRNINYTLYHSEKKKFEHPWGPLVYIHPENDWRLRTWNIMCEMNDDMSIKSYHHIDTSKFPDKELWEFVGLEDCRIVRWNDKLYITGVRRDLDTIGTGRMELSEIEFTESGVKEISQRRIPAPPPDQEYCNKNWMPILDMPYHYVKWTNGTEIVKYDIETNITSSVLRKDWKDFGTIDLRGGSQIIPVGEYRMCLTHETYLTKSSAGRKDGIYRHRFVVWDKDWNIIKVSRQFSFMNAEIEFAVGMVEYKGDYLITFGYQDNAAYLVRVSKEFVLDFIGMNEEPIKEEILTFDYEHPTESLEGHIHFYGNDNFGEGWFYYPNLYSRIVKQFPSGSRFVEVGCWKGKSASYMCVEIANSNKDIEFFCVDTWEGSVEHEGMEELPKLYDIFTDNMRPVEEYYFPLKMTSLEAVKKFKDNSLDFVFIDASHEYEDVRDDILAWYPKVKPGGIIAGPDYYHEEHDWFPGVTKAVNELLTGFILDEHCWIYHKSEDSKLNDSSFIDSEKENSHLNILFFARNSGQEIAEYDFILNDILPEKTKKDSYFLSLDEIRTTGKKFDVFVYSCRDPNNYPWGYMPTYADTLECVLKTQPKIVIQLSDEFYFEDLQLHNDLSNYCNLFLRQHNHLNYTYTENTSHIPLGYTNDCEAFSSPKKYDWSFIGEVKSDREEMINTFSRMPNHFVSTNIGRKEMCEIYSQSTFVLCGRGNSSLNCFRQYEASMNGAIPVIVGSKEEIEYTFKYEQNPPWIFASTWESAFEICSDLLKNPEYLDEWKTKLLSWWSDRLLYIQSKVNMIIDGGENIIQNSLENKLKNLPPVHYISVDYCTERREKLHQKFSQFGIENITGHIFQKYDDTQHEIVSEYIDRLSIGSRGPVTSHLKAIKQWYDNTDEEVAFFCEDDLSMELVQYWNFTWDNFYNSLPEDWEIVQLAWLREGQFDRFKIGFRNRCWCDWSGCAYIIKREFAKKLIDTYYYDGRFHLDVQGSDVYLREDWAKVPVIETIIFSPLGRVYGAPLFTEDLSFMPSYLDPNTEEGKKQPVNSYHHESYHTNLNWWRNIGSTQTIEEFMRE